MNFSLHIPLPQLGQEKKPYRATWSVGLTFPLDRWGTRHGVQDKQQELLLAQQAYAQATVQNQAAYSQALANYHQQLAQHAVAEQALHISQAQGARIQDDYRAQWITRVAVQEHELRIQEQAIAVLEAAYAVNMAVLRLEQLAPTDSACWDTQAIP